MDSVSIAQCSAMTRRTISVCCVYHRCAARSAIPTWCWTVGAQSVDPVALRTVTLRFTNALKPVTAPHPSHGNDDIQPTPYPCNRAERRLYG